VKYHFIRFLRGTFGIDVTTRNKLYDLYGVMFQDYADNNTEALIIPESSRNLRTNDRDYKYALKFHINLVSENKLEEYCKKQFGDKKANPMTFESKEKNEIEICFDITPFEKYSIVKWIDNNMDNAGMHIIVNYPSRVNDNTDLLVIEDDIFRISEVGTVNMNLARDKGIPIVSLSVFKAHRLAYLSNKTPKLSDQWKPILKAKLMTFEAKVFKVYLSVSIQDNMKIFTMLMDLLKNTPYRFEYVNDMKRCDIVVGLTDEVVEQLRTHWAISGTHAVVMTAKDFISKYVEAKSIQFESLYNDIKDLI